MYLLEPISMSKGAKFQLFLDVTLDADAARVLRGTPMSPRPPPLGLYT